MQTPGETLTKTRAKEALTPFGTVFDSYMVSVFLHVQPWEIFR